MFFKSRFLLLEFKGRGQEVIMRLLCWQGEVGERVTCFGWWVLEKVGGEIGGIGWDEVG